MHLPDTVLLDNATGSGLNPVGIGLVVAGAVIAVAGLAAGSRRMTAVETGRAGMLTAFVFLASAIHVPIPPAASVHLGLYGLAGILLGKRVLLVSPIAFGLQALLFGHGGIAAIGLNSVNMSAGALLALGWFRMVGRKRPVVAAFGAGFIGILVMAILTLIDLIAVNYSVVVLAAIPGYLAAGVLEGVVTVLVLGTLVKRFPELLPHPAGKAT